MISLHVQGGKKGELVQYAPVLSLRHGEIVSRIRPSGSTCGLRGRCGCVGECVGADMQQLARARHVFREVTSAQTL